jgi:hypothetical protein
VALLFFEPSSRTILSFHAAAARLGAAVISHRGVESSSLSKGESIEDTVRVVSAYADLIVLRHEASGVAQRAADVSSVALINGGDGPNEHPTQALIDLYTIQQELGRLDSLRVGIGFDPRHSRSTHSLCRGLSHYPDNDVLLVGPSELWLGEPELAELRQRGLRVAQSEDKQALLSARSSTSTAFRSSGSRTARPPRHTGSATASPPRRCGSRRSSCCSTPCPASTRSPPTWTTCPRPPTSARPRTAYQSGWRCFRCWRRETGGGMGTCFLSGV